MNKEQAIKDLKQRQKDNAKNAKIDNVTLRAGSSMHYYCSMCNHHTILPENHSQPAPQRCWECQNMIDDGYSPADQQYHEYENTTCPKCGGSGLGVRDYYLKRRRRCSGCNGSGTIKRLKQAAL